MLTWHYVTREAYDAASTADKTSDKLYFLSDTHEIYKGTDNFTASVILYDTEPTTKAVNKLYVNQSTLEGKIWNGSAWVTVIQPVQSTLTSTDTTKPVSGKAVADYVKDQIANVTGSGDLVAGVSYDATTNKFTVTMADDTTDDIELTNVAVDLVYDSATGKLQVKNAAGTTIGTGINLDLERFVSNAEYDADNKVIKLTFNDNQDPLEIDVASLVDTYTAKSSSTIAMTVTNNEFTAEAIVSTATGNMLTKTDAGLFVAATDISGKVDKVDSATAGDVATLTADGGISDSGVKVGGSTLAATPSASVLATEAAVEAIRTALVTSIGAKMDKVATGKTGEILTADAEGNAAASGVKIGSGVSSSSTNATVATEKGVYDFVSDYAVAKTDVTTSMATTTTAASDKKVPSEKTVVDALTWKTTV